MVFRRQGLPLLLGLSTLAPLPAASGDLPEVKQRGVLRVLRMDVRADDEFFPLPRGGAPAAPGFDREVLEGFASLHRLRLEPVTVSSWDALIPALLEARGDVIAGRFTVTEARQRQVAFTAEVFPTRNVVLTRYPTRVVATLAELRAEKVGTIRGTSMAEAVAAAGVPRDQVLDTITTGRLPEALKTRAVTAVVLGVENAITAQRDDPAIQLGLFLGPPRRLAYAVRKGDAALLAALDEYIENLRRTPTWSRLVVKYFGEAAPEILKKARQE
jgi:ABC-type amino acid transport substrate-binding protein